MQISREELSRRYASFSDAELLALDRNDLTELAQQCFDRELKRRRLLEKTKFADAEFKVDAHEAVSADWVDTAVTACSFQVGAGRHYAEDAQRACAILREAGIPCQAVTAHEDGGPDVLNVIVPGALSLTANSVLDRDWFNEEVEETWRTHFDQLTDKELRSLDVDELCAGLLDRAARLRRVYENALARRGAGAQAS
jgi:hypothetical protein